MKKTSKTKPALKAKAKAAPKKKPTESLTFEILRKRHGDIEAMRILESLECMALAERQKNILLAEPAQRFTDAMAHLIKSAEGKTIAQHCDKKAA